MIFLKCLFNNAKYEKQKIDLSNNKRFIQKENQTLFKNSAFLFFVVTSLLVVLTFFFREIRQGRIVYLISAISGGLFYLLALFFKKHSSLSLPFHYGLYTVGFFLACEDAIFINNGRGSAVVFCGVILVFSVLTIDYTYRINGYILLLTIIFVLFAWFFESTAYAVRDFTDAISFFILAIAIGRVSRSARLSDFENQRILQIERNIDTLTGIPNRRSLFDSLIVCENPAHPAPYTGSIMIDIDNFKTYNDTYGHLAGDKVLKQIGYFLKDYGADFKFDVFRYGGEEFLIMTRGMDFRMLDTLAGNIVRTVRDLKISYPVSVPGIVTLSAGYAFSEKNDHIQYEELIKHADEALYTAKRSGRNQTSGYINS